MTATVTEDDTETSLDLEELFKEDIPCVYEGVDHCGKPAKWRVTYKPCGHSFEVCNMHRGLLLAWWATARDRYCAKSKTHITDWEWEEL